MAESKIILFVEDEEPTARALGDLFQKRGIELINAPDGAIGLEQLKIRRPSLVLLDLILPRMHGFEFLEKAKSDSELKAIPIIVLSNLSGDLNVTKAKNLGAADYLVKTDTNGDEIVNRVLGYL
ncbi:MAG: response regulator [Patescibacteria group bacterium]|nr:response regulator [Patescibacteria group bacterium]MDD5566795.1 response regulator [Patescibacteria group bacterium]